MSFGRHCWLRPSAFHFLYLVLDLEVGFIGFYQRGGGTILAVGSTLQTSKYPHADGGGVDCLLIEEGKEGSDCTKQNSSNVTD